MDDWQSALDSIRKAPEVVAAAPEVIAETIVINEADYPTAVNVLGLDTAALSLPVTSIPSVVTEGDLTFRTTRDSVEGGIIIGRRLADRLSAFPGDVVTLVPPTAAKVNPALGYAVPRFWKFEVTGIFETGMYQYDNQFIVMPRETAQRFTGLGDAITGIEVRVTDPWRAPEIGQALLDRLGFFYRSLDWQSQNAALFSALQLEKLAMGLVIFFIMLVAAFNIVGTLTMVVNDKIREIGILQAMGLPAPAIGRIFLAQGAIIGAIGVALGLVGGLLVAYAVDRGRWIRINPQVYFIDHLPVHVEAPDVVVVAIAGFLLAVVATMYPSRSATRLTPVEAIRHE
jgi:lipoprotein-releasing system permease protein